jgi:hypothetical protein
MRGIEMCAAAAIGLGMGAGGGAGCADRSTGRTHESQEHVVMTEPVRTLSTQRKATVVIQQGTEHFDDGQLAITIRGDGAVSVEQRQSGQRHEFSAQLDAARFAAVVDALAANHFTKTRTSKLPRNPGDTPLVLRFDDAGPAPFHAELWYGDRYSDAEIDRIIRLADDLIHTASAGTLGQAAPR